jgi:hypothetical protein
VVFESRQELFESKIEEKSDRGAAFVSAHVGGPDQSERERGRVRVRERARAGERERERGRERVRESERKELSTKGWLGVSHRPSVLGAVQAGAVLAVLGPHRFDRW